MIFRAVAGIGINVLSRARRWADAISRAISVSVPFCAIVTLRLFTLARLGVPLVSIGARLSRCVEAEAFAIRRSYEEFTRRALYSWAVRVAIARNIVKRRAFWAGDASAYVIVFYAGAVRCSVVISICRAGWSRVA